MRATQHLDRGIVVLVPEPADDPGDLEDRIHDEVVRGRRAPGDTASAVKVVILDLSGQRDTPRWLKAMGPQVPDVNVRVALGGPGYAVARALGVPALYEWYPTVEDALRGGV